MKFFSLESSKKLAEIGCVSKTRHEYYQNINGVFMPCIGVEGEGIPAFTPFDFLSSEEYSLENCKKLWGEDVTTAASDPSGKVLPGVYYFKSGYTQKRKDMLDAPDQIKFVEEFL